MSCVCIRLFPAAHFVLFRSHDFFAQGLTGHGGAQAGFDSVGSFAGTSAGRCERAGEVQEWSDDPAALRAWQQGRTGFPLVDAGMRQLWQTGWMQQSIRMVCAAFLTEYLSMHWLHGCR